MPGTYEQCHCYTFLTLFFIFTAATCCSSSFTASVQCNHTGVQKFTQTIYMHIAVVLLAQYISITILTQYTYIPKRYRCMSNSFDIIVCAGSIIQAHTNTLQQYVDYILSHQQYHDDTEWKHDAVPVRIMEGTYRSSRATNTACCRH